MNDWVVEQESFIEELLNDKYVMLNQNGVKDVVKIIKDYKSRIDKAIYFIKNTKVLSYEQDDVYLFKDIPEGYDLLNILQGSDNFENI